MPRRTTFTESANFITMTVVDWIDLFTRQEYKDFLIACLRHCQKNKGLEIYAYVIMTNHVHLVVRTVGNQSLSNILRDLKSYSAKRLIEMIFCNPQESRKQWLLAMFAQHGRANPLNEKYQVWQNGSYPTALTTNAMMQQKIDYIHFNPVQAGIVNEPYEYLYSSIHPLSPLTINER